jgi:uncharacterized membrane protein
MLLSNIIPGYSLAEAKDSLVEYEQFKTAMEASNLLVVFGVVLCCVVLCCVVLCCVVLCCVVLCGLI